MSANMFPYGPGNYFGYHLWALNKAADVRRRAEPAAGRFRGRHLRLLAAARQREAPDGHAVPGEPEFFVSTEQFLNALSIYKFHVDWNNVSASTFSGPDTQLTSSCWPDAFPANASTPANSADTLAIRAMAQAQYSNIGGAESLWVAHTVNRGEFTGGSCGNANANNATCAGIRRT